MKPNIEDLTFKQLVQAYKELEAGHTEAITKANEEIAGLKATCAQETARLNQKYIQLETEFKARPFRTPADFLDEFDHDVGKGLYTRKSSPGQGYICGHCLPKPPHITPLVCKEGHGWRCKVCNTTFTDDGNRPPPPESIPRGPRFLL